MLPVAASCAKNIPTVTYQSNMLEVCVDSLESARTAIDSGADELELCSALNQGGLTPSVGLVAKVLSMVFNLDSECGNKRPKVNVMIRCHAGPDFCYTEDDLETMLMDIDIFKSLGVDRFVFGSLTPTKDVDHVQCKKVLDQANPAPVTFHRAIDVCSDPIAALKDIIDLGFSRVLTSGKEPTVCSSDAIAMLKKMQSLYGDKIEIMPGAGVKVDNVAIFTDLGFKILHSSCKILKRVIKIDNDLDLGNMIHVYQANGSDISKIKKIITAA